MHDSAADFSVAGGDSSIAAPGSWPEADPWYSSAWDMPTAATAVVAATTTVAAHGLQVPHPMTSAALGKPPMPGALAAKKGAVFTRSRKIHL